MGKTLQLTIGYSDLYIAQVLQHSIRRRASIGTDFRFVLRVSNVVESPLLWNYEGDWSIFLDAKMLCLCDIKELTEHFDPQYAVQFVKFAEQPLAVVVFNHNKFGRTPDLHDKEIGDLPSEFNSEFPTAKILRYDNDPYNSQLWKDELDDMLRTYS